MSFPVVCYVERRGHLGETLDESMKRSGRELTKAIIEAVVKQAAFSMGIQIALMFVPIIGWAISGLVSVTQMIVGKYYQKQMNDVIADTMEAIKQRGAAVEARVMAAGEKVYMEELPAGRALAMSDQPLPEGLSGWWGDFTGSVRKVVKTKIAAPVRKFIKDPKMQVKALVALTPIGMVGLAVQQIGRAAVSTAKAIESTNIIGKGDLSSPLRKASVVTNDVMFSAGKLASPFTQVQETVGLVGKHGGQIVAAAFEATGNEGAAEEARRIGGGIHTGAQETMTALTPAGSFNLFTGREGLVAAREACENMRTKAFAQLDQMATEGIAKLQTPECRQTMRVAIAKKLREDPVFNQQMQELRDLEAAEKAALNVEEAKLTAIVGTGTASKAGAGTFMGVAAAVAAAFVATR